MGTQSWLPTNKLRTCFVDQAVYEDDHCGLLENRSLPHTIPFSRPDCCPYILHKVTFGTLVIVCSKEKNKVCEIREVFFVQNAPKVWNEIAETVCWKIREIGINSLQLLQLRTWWKKHVYQARFSFSESPSPTREWRIRKPLRFWGPTTDWRKSGAMYVLPFDGQMENIYGLSAERWECGRAMWEKSSSGMMQL